MGEIYDEQIHKKYSTLIVDGFRLYRKNFKNLVLTWLVFKAIYNLLYVLILTDLRYHFAIFNIPTLFYRIIKYSITWGLGLIGVIQVCSTSSFLFKYYTLVDIKFMDDFRRGINSRLKYPIFISIIFFIIFGVILDLNHIIIALLESGLSGFDFVITIQIISWSIFFISLIISSIFIFVRYTYNIKDIERPIYKARSLTKGIFWKIVLILLIDAAIVLVISFLWSLFNQFLVLTVFQDIYIEAYLPPSNYVFIFLYRMFYNLPTIILGSLGVCLITPLFAHQYLKRENEILEDKR